MPAESLCSVCGFCNYLYLPKPDRQNFLAHPPASADPEIQYNGGTDVLTEWVINIPYKKLLDNSYVTLIVNDNITTFFEGDAANSLINGQFQVYINSGDDDTYEERVGYNNAYIQNVPNTGEFPYFMPVNINFTHHQTKSDVVNFKITFKYKHKNGDYAIQRIEQEWESVFHIKEERV